MKYPFIKMNILQYVATKGELTGYSFMQYCKKRGIPVSNGTIYPHLKDLESGGLLECTIDGKRKVYRLTDYGKEWIINSTNASIPTILKHSFFRLNRSFDMVKWDNSEEVKLLIAEVEGIHTELEEYILSLEKEEEVMDDMLVE